MSPGPAAPWALLALLPLSCACGQGSTARDSDHEPRPTSARALDGAGLPQRPGAHVLLVTVDALRADHLGTYGYGRGVSPEIDALAAQAVVFERAWAQAPHSSWSLCSLMTGEHLHDVARLGRAMPAETLASVAAAAGYRTLAFYTDGIFYTEDPALVGYRDGHLGFGRHDSDNPDAEERTDRVLAEIDRLLEEGEPPTLLWAHYFDPHEPYRETRLGTSTLDRYDGEIQNADRAIGRLIREARARLSREVVVVITADHGEELRDHGGISHGSKLYEEQIRVPLIVHVPGLEPARATPPVQLVDVAPTVLALIAAPRPASMRGDDLRPLLVGRPFDPGPAFSEVAGRRAVRLGDRKLIATLAPVALEHYDLATDPREQHDLALDRDSRDLLAALHAHLDALAGREPDPPRSVALGLLGDGRAAPGLVQMLGDPALAPGARADAARLLGELRAGEGRSALARAARDGDAAVRAEAAVALAALGDAQARRRLIAALPEIEEPERRARAAIALGRLGGREAVPALVQALDAGHPYELRRDAVIALYRLPDERAFEALVALTEDSRLSYRAITALGLSGDPRAFGPLVALLDAGPRAMIRDGILRALGWLGDRRAVPPLLAHAAADPELIYATESLVRLGALDDGAIGGLDLGPGPRGLRGLRACRRGSPTDVGYRWLTTCRTAATELLLPLPLPAGAPTPLVGVLSARRTDAADPVRVILAVGDAEHAFEVGGWAEHRFELGPVEGARVVARLRIADPPAALELDHLLLLPRPRSAGAEEDAALEEVAQ